MANNTKTKPLDLLLQARIESKIYLIRGKRVMLDRDLAELYGVETRILNQAVRRNKERFLDDFMFQLSKEELEITNCDIPCRNGFVTSSSGGVIPSGLNQ